MSIIILLPHPFVYINSFDPCRRPRLLRLRLHTRPLNQIFKAKPSPVCFALAVREGDVAIVVREEPEADEVAPDDGTAAATDAGAAVSGPHSSGVKCGWATAPQGVVAQRRTYGGLSP